MKSAACVLAIVLSCSLSPAGFAAAVSDRNSQDQAANGAERTVFESLFDMTDSVLPHSPARPMGSSCQLPMGS